MFVSSLSPSVHVTINWLWGPASIRQSWLRLIHLPSEDQFAFRPTGSTTAALIFLFDRITELLVDNSFVMFYSLDFSKAFDTVRHSTFFEKLALLKTPIEVYNWIADFYSARTHCTSFNGVVSELLETRKLLEILASVIQGSGIGPAAYAVNAADLRTVNPKNSLSKFADDTGLIVGENQVASRLTELNNINDRAVRNNLCLNQTKSAEMVFINQRTEKRNNPPPPINGISRVRALKFLGVTITDNLSMNDHVTKSHCILQTGPIRVTNDEISWNESCGSSNNFPGSDCF